MFLENKYSKCYKAIIDRARSRNKPIEYCERHHVLPKSLGGNVSKSNEVWLTGREHYICHLLLTKMVDGINRRKMLYAFMLMSTHGLTKNDKSRGFKKLGGRTFQKLREEFRAAISEDRKGKSKFSKTPELTAAKKSAKLKGRIYSDETKRKMSESAKKRSQDSRVGIKLSEEVKQRMSIAAKKREEKKRKIKQT